MWISVKCELLKCKGRKPAWKTIHPSDCSVSLTGGNRAILAALSAVRCDNNHCGQFTCHISRYGGVSCRRCRVLLSTSSGQCVNRLLKSLSLFRFSCFYRIPKIHYRSRTVYFFHTSTSTYNNNNNNSNNCHNIRQWLVVY